MQTKEDVDTHASPTQELRPRLEATEESRKWNAGIASTETLTVPVDGALAGETPETTAPLKLKTLEEVPRNTFAAALKTAVWTNPTPLEALKVSDDEETQREKSQTLRPIRLAMEKKGVLPISAVKTVTSIAPEHGAFVLASTLLCRESTDSTVVNEPLTLLAEARMDRENPVPDDVLQARWLSERQTVADATVALPTESEIELQ